jgi:hypothetical protein
MADYYLLVVGIMVTSLSFLLWSVKDKLRERPVRSNRVN